MDSLVSTQWLAEHLGEPDLVIVDSSWFMPASGRKAGDEFSAAHIPGARNLPFGALFNEDGTFKPIGEIRRLFDEAEIDPAEPFAASCGSGVTATVLIFAAHLLGNDSAQLYDGSWSEWGVDPATPKAVGPA